MYKSESAFSKAFVESLRNRHIVVTRIETGSTSQGVPDLYIQGYGGDLWIELKNKKSKVDRRFFKIDWRPGQQAWHSIYYKEHWYKKMVFTIMADLSGFEMVPMSRIYVDNLVASENVEHFDMLGELTDRVVSILKGQSGGC